VVDNEHKAIQKALDEIKDNQKTMNDRLDTIEEKLDPIIKDRDGRAWLDEKVSKWLPRVPYIALLVSAIIWYFVNKPSGQ